PLLLPSHALRALSAFSFRDVYAAKFLIVHLHSQTQSAPTPGKGFLNKGFAGSEQVVVFPQWRAVPHVRCEFGCSFIGLSEVHSRHTLLESHAASPPVRSGQFLYLPSLQ